MRMGYIISDGLYITTKVRGQNKKILSKRTLRVQSLDHLSKMSTKLHCTIGTAVMHGFACDRFAERIG
jgi:hypothetical protein